MPDEQWWRQLDKTCHVCGDERPDEFISVVHHTVKGPKGVDFEENVRYCNDRPDCIAKAQTYHHVPMVRMVLVVEYQAWPNEDGELREALNGEAERLKAGGSLDHSQVVGFHVAIRETADTIMKALGA